MCRWNYSWQSCKLDDWPTKQIQQGILRHQTPPRYRNATIAVRPITAKRDVINKPEVHNISQCLQRRTEPWPQGICTQNFMRIGAPVPEICLWTQTHRQIGWSQYSAPLLGRSNKLCGRPHKKFAHSVLDKDGSYHEKHGCRTWLSMISCLLRLLECTRHCFIIPACSHPVCWLKQHCTGIRNPLPSPSIMKPKLASCLVKLSGCSGCKTVQLLLRYCTTVKAAFKCTLGVTVLYANIASYK